MLSPIFTSLICSFLRVSNQRLVSPTLETKRWFETRKKEHMRYVKNGDNNATALSKHAVELGHSIDWKNYEILQIETDYHKRKFIESFYINSLSNVLNEKKKNPFVFLLYTKICFRNITFQFSRSITKRKNCCCAIVNYFDSFCFIDCVTWFSVFAMLIFRLWLIPWPKAGSLYCRNVELL